MGQTPKSLIKLRVDLVGLVTIDLVKGRKPFNVLPFGFLQANNNTTPWKLARAGE